MKKITLLFAFVLATLAWQTQAQAVNDVAGWPNTNWAVDQISHTGSDPMDIEQDPTTDPMFGYDDDDTGSGSHDIIAAESPVIDLTAAQTAGENFLHLTGGYVFNFISTSEYLAIEYWDADASDWAVFYQFPNADTPGAPYNDYYTATFVDYDEAIDISGFTAAQLAGFKYRFIYNDNTAGGTGWKYGFAFNSPTLFSAAFLNPEFTLTNVQDCTNNQYSVTVDVTSFGGATSVTVSDDQGSATQQLTAIGQVTFGPYTSASAVNITVTNDQDTSVQISENTVSYCPPANDECDAAITLTVNTDENCGTTTAGYNVSATASAQADDAVGTPNNDVWFSFVATETSHIVSLENITAVVGTSTDMVMAVYDATAGCGSLTLVDDSDPNAFIINGLSVGTTYLLRVYGYSNAQTNFDVCVGTPPAPPANDECDAAITLTVNEYDTCDTTTSGTTVNATASPQTDDVTGTPDNDVWYTFVATQTEHVIELSNVAAVLGTSVDMGMGLYDGTNGCSSLTFVDGSDPNTMTVSTLTVGNTYYLRIYGWYSGASSAQATFDVCVRTNTSSIADNQIAGFNFYPNPVNHTLNLSAQDQIENVNIYNITGQEVMHTQPNAVQAQVDMSQLQNGIYFVKAQINGQVTAFKIVKK